MQDITISRYDQDPEAQGVIKPKNGRWQLVVDKDGYPHLYVQVKLDTGGTGTFCVEDMFPPEIGIRDLMDGGEFGGAVTDPEELETCSREHDERVQRLSIPCPR